MIENIRIDLDTVRVYGRSGTWTTPTRAKSSLGHEIIGDGKILTKMAKILREENPDFDGLLEIWRGDTLCFVPMPLKFAFVATGNQPEWLKSPRKQAPSD